MLYVDLTIITSVAHGIVYCTATPSAAFKLSSGLTSGVATSSRAIVSRTGLPVAAATAVL